MHFVKIGRFGATDDDLRYQEVVEGNAFQLADKVLDVLDKKFLISPISYEGLQRVENWEYPLCCNQGSHIECNCT